MTKLIVTKYLVFIEKGFCVLLSFAGCFATLLKSFEIYFSKKSAKKSLRKRFATLQPSMILPGDTQLLLTFWAPKSDISDMIPWSLRTVVTPDTVNIMKIFWHFRARAWNFLQNGMQIFVFWLIYSWKIALQSQIFDIKKGTGAERFKKAYEIAKITRKLTLALVFAVARLVAFTLGAFPGIKKLRKSVKCICNPLLN